VIPHCISTKSVYLLFRSASRGVYDIIYLEHKKDKLNTRYSYLSRSTSFFVVVKLFRIRHLFNKKRSGWLFLCDFVLLHHFSFFLPQMNCLWGIVIFLCIIGISPPPNFLPFEISRS
jgi:hypothetical protein